MPRPQRTRTVSDLLGAPPPPTTGRDRIVAAAIELFYAQGFQAVGLDSVLARAGVTKTTFYKHFEDKDALMVEAVRQRDAWESEAWSRAVATLAGDDPRGKLLAFFDVLDTWFNDPSFQGCVFLNTASEFPDPRHPVHKAAAAHKRANRDLFRDLAKDAGVPDPETFADLYTALMEGTLVLRQVHGRDDAARAIRPAIERLLDSSVGGSGTEPGS
jgi:AcrR family transcriptional regulator